MKTRSVKRTDLKPDPENANLGTERGTQLLRKSLEELGAGRSIVVDKNGVTIAGNKTLEQAAELGLKFVQVETDGTALVVVKRNDLDLMEDDRARLLAFADNRVAELSLNWDHEKILEAAESLDLSEFYRQDELDQFLMQIRDEAPDGVDLQDGTTQSQTSFSAKPPVLRWEDYSILLSEQEAEELSAAAEAWADSSGSFVGFVKHLLRK